MPELKEGFKRAHFIRMSVKWITAFLLLQLGCYFSSGSCGKVLVWPMDYSLWINMKTILEELVKRGHEVVVLTPETSIFIDPKKTSDLKFEVFATFNRKGELEEMIQKMLVEWIYALYKDSFLTQYSKQQDFFWKFYDNFQQLCKDAVRNEKLMKKLHESRFDLVFADAFGPCGELLAELLNIPFVYSFRFTPGYQFEKHIGKLPLPPSYAPVVLSELSDRMTFMERVKNMLYVLYFDFWFQMINQKSWDKFYSEVLGRPTTLYEIMGKADIWLIRNYWDFGFPQPYLPNFEFVGGLQCKPANPLPKEMEEFAQSAGEDGIVIFTLGSMVDNMTEERANVIASALAQIPQKVLWRFNGKKPETLGKNTRLYKWLPQNDLLGHPKTKAFITHGGAGGVYEAIYHGIPMVGIPLFADQPDNIAQMMVKGAAVKLNFQEMTSTDLLNALKTVINNPSYKENIMKLSRIHHDQPMKPMDRAIFWIEYVMRNKGAKHLRPASHDLTWVQEHSLDVIGFLLACVAAAVYIITKCFLFCCRKVFRTGKDKRD